MNFSNTDLPVLIKLQKGLFHLFFILREDCISQSDKFSVEEVNHFRYSERKNYFHGIVYKLTTEKQEKSSAD